MIFVSLLLSDGFTDDVDDDEDNVGDGDDDDSGDDGDEEYIERQFALIIGRHFSLPSVMITRSFFFVF